MGEPAEALNTRIGLRLNPVSREVGMVPEQRGDPFKARCSLWGRSGRLVV